MRKFRLYRDSKNKDYKFFDNIVKEHIYVGGTDIYVYRYLGPDQENSTSDDLTQPQNPDSTVTDIGDMVWMENSSRKYDVNPIKLPVSYQMQDPTLQLSIPGLFLFDTTQMVFHYNQMIDRIGRKLMNGDVIEVPHLRDEDPLNENSTVGLARFYVVNDAFRPASGYSPTWYHHLYAAKLLPITDSPEFKDIFGDGTDENDLTNTNSSRDKELEIMDIILAQTASEVPYIHYDNEHIHDDLSNTKGSFVPYVLENGEVVLVDKYQYSTINGETNLNDPHDQREQPIPYKDMDSGDAFPDTPTDGMYFKRTDFTPFKIYQYDSSKSQWREYDFGGRKPWVGADQNMARFVNTNGETSDGEDVRVPIADVVKPNIKF